MDVEMIEHTRRSTRSEGKIARMTELTLEEEEEEEEEYEFKTREARLAF
jgi:hypothetical protein